MSSMIERVGFFHFIEAYTDPLGELTKCLEKHSRSSIRNSLIVLPEGFNLGRQYNVELCEAGVTREKPRFDAACMLQFLGGIAVTREISFVVGVIDEHRFSCGYYVDGQEPRQMCRKINPDGSREYKACEKNCHGENPVSVGEVCVGTLICMDAVEQNPDNNPSNFKTAANERRKRLLCDLDWSQRSVLCIPAYMSDKFPERDGTEGKWVVIANSRLDGCGSRIVNGNGTLVEECKCRQNQVCIREDLRSKSRIVAAQVTLENGLP
jgi:hypothetical protein